MSSTLTNHTNKCDKHIENDEHMNSLNAQHDSQNNTVYNEPNEQEGVKLSKLQLLII